MNYWEFESIMHTLHMDTLLASGKPIIHDYNEHGLPSDIKAMIERRKKQR